MDPVNSYHMIAAFMIVFSNVLWIWSKLTTKRAQKSFVFKLFDISVGHKAELAFYLVNPIQ